MPEFNVDDQVTYNVKRLAFGGKKADVFYMAFWTEDDVPLMLNFDEDVCRRIHRGLSYIVKYLDDNKKPDFWQ